MGYNNQIPMDSEDSSASFNDALNHITRIDICLRLIQFSKVNPFQINLDFSVPNFQVRMINLSSLWQEIKPFCDSDERNFVERIFTVINSFATKLIRFSKNETVFEFQEYPAFDAVANFLESKLRDLQLAKGLGNPLKRREISI